MGRLETSEDFKAEKTLIEPKTSEIEELKIIVRNLSKEDVKERKLPDGTTGIVITGIKQNSPLKDLVVNNIIIEVQKNKIKTVGDFKNLIKTLIKKFEKSILLTIYNNQNRRQYIGIKLN